MEWVEKVVRTFDTPRRPIVEDYHHGRGPTTMPEHRVEATQSICSDEAEEERDMHFGRKRTFWGFMSARRGD